eukprot:467574_1
MALFLFLVFYLVGTNVAIVSPTTTNTTAQYFITSISTRFSDDDIICTNFKCIVTCNINNGCTNTNINASLSNVLILTCNNISSCDHINVIGSSNLTQLQCLQQDACEYANIDVKHTVNVDINCALPAITPCSKININAEYATNVNIACEGENFACAHATLNVNHTETVTITTARAGLWYANIIAINVSSSFNIYCGDYDDSCSTATIYCPVNIPCNLYCNGTWSSCRSMDIFFVQDFKNTSLNLLCNDESCNQMRFNCLHENVHNIYVWNDYKEQYQCHKEYCCPYLFQQSVIQCNVNSDCIVNCMDYNDSCILKHINGTHTNSLTIYCTDCSFAQIYCPHNGACNIYCLSQDYSCIYAEIFGNIQITSLLLHCMSYSACHRLSTPTDIIVTDFVNILCNGTAPCTDMDIHFKGVSKYNLMSNFLIVSKGNNAMRWSDLYLTHINQVNILCLFGDATCMHMQVTTLNIGTLNIVCATQETCRNSDWNLNAANITFECDTFLSCSYGIIMANISNSLMIKSNNASYAFGNTELSVSCSECINIYNCMSEIIFYCGDNYNAIMYSDTNECNNCLCDSNTNEFIDVEFHNDMWQVCLPSYQPTVQTMQPSIYLINIVETGIYEYGILITITFEYDLNANKSNISDIDFTNIFNQLIANEINQLTGDTICISNNYKVNTFELSDNKKLINATIFTCNKQTQNQLKVNFEQHLQKDFIDIVKHETNVDIKVDEIDIQKVDKTDSSNENKMNKNVWIIVIIICFIVLIIILLIIFMI